MGKEGYTRCPNDVLEALMAAKDITRSESKIVLSVARYSFGFQRETAPLSIGWLERITDLPRRTVRRCLSSLVRKKVLKCEGNERILGKGQKVNIWEISPPERWEVGVVASPPDDEVGVVASPLNAPGVRTGDRKVCTVASPNKEREKENTTEEAAFLLDSRFFSRDKKLTKDPEAFIDAWKDARPDLDILHSLKKAEAYLLSTSKNYSNYATFLTNWMNRERANGSKSVLSEEEHLAEIEADARKYGLPK